MLLLGLLTAVYMVGFRKGTKETENRKWAQTVSSLSAGKKAREPKHNSHSDLLVIQAADESALPETQSQNSTATAKPKAPSKMAVSKSVKQDKRGRQPPAGFYGLQLGAFRSKEEARNFVSKNKKSLENLPVFLTAVRIKNRGQWTRVRAGALRTRKMALGLKAELAQNLKRGSIVVRYR